jgi:hypothetical protein
MECVVSKLQIGILALAAACAASAVPRYIGVISAEGGLWVDSAGVSDHATVFEGSIVETTDAPATVQIGKTVRVLLDTNSRRTSMPTTYYWREAVASLTAARITEWRRRRCG